MLNFVNLLKKNDITVSKRKGNMMRMHKKDIPMNKEWYNSLYTFNNYSVRFLPTVYNHTFKLLKWYFNMVNDWMEEKHANNLKKTWVSNPEIKHLNEKINITVYIYNELYNNHKKNSEFFQFNIGPILKQTKDLSILNNFRSMHRKFPTYLGTKKMVYSTNGRYYQEIVKWLKLNKYIHLSQYKYNILNVKNEKKEYLNTLLNDLEVKNYDYLINQFNRELIYFKLRQKILFCELKYNEVYISIIIRFLQEIYKKKIEFNIVILKYFWLNSSILLQILTARVKNPINRGKYLASLDYVMGMIKVPILSKTKFAGESKPFLGVQNKKLDRFVSDKKDYLNNFLLANNTKSKIWTDKNIDELVLSNLDNKIIAGVFLKVSGRLTKRYKAQKAIKKLSCKGTLKNVYSAHRNHSSYLSKGYIGINIEQTKIFSKTRIGSFGITGWIASY